MLYPALRVKDAFPTKALVEFASYFNEDRAGSLAFRFGQEDILLAHASERLLLGWGRYGRSRVYSSDSGDHVTIPDGMWIITIGEYGILGFLAQFGLLALSVCRAAAALRLIRQREDRLCFSGLALIVAITLVEQLPNASINPWSWLLSGLLLGNSELLEAKARRIASSRGVARSDSEAHFNDKTRPNAPSNRDR
jgi:hypothetical protein